MLFLITNDDGIHASGLQALSDAVSSLGTVFVVAPDGQRSAISHAISLHRPLRVTRLDARRFVVDGTPTDAVHLGVNLLLPRPPDLVLSGINHGANLGPDVTYSGTVGAAMEGVVQGVPSLSFSMVRPATPDSPPLDFSGTGPMIEKIVGAVAREGLPQGTMLNVNFPAGFQPGDGEICGGSLGKHEYDHTVLKRVDPRGGVYYWIGGGVPKAEDAPDTDCSIVARGDVSVTPLRLDMTDHEMLKKLGEWSL